MSREGLSEAAAMVAAMPKGYLTRVGPDRCRKCGAKLPTDRLEYAAELEKVGTRRACALAARLRDDQCTSHTEPSARGGSLGDHHAEGQKAKKGRTDS